MEGPSSGKRRPGRPRTRPIPDPNTPKRPRGRPTREESLRRKQEQQTESMRMDAPLEPPPRLSRVEPRSKANWKRKRSGTQDDESSANDSTDSDVESNSDLQGSGTALLHKKQKIDRRSKVRKRVTVFPRVPRRQPFPSDPLDLIQQPISQYLSWCEEIDEVLGPGAMVLTERRVGDPHEPLSDLWKLMLHMSILRGLCELIVHPLWERSVENLRYILQWAVCLRVRDHMKPVGPFQSELARSLVEKKKDLIRLGLTDGSSEIHLARQAFEDLQNRRLETSRPVYAALIHCLRQRITHQQPAAFDGADTLFYLELADVSAVRNALDGLQRKNWFPFTVGAYYKGCLVTFEEHWEQKLGRMDIATADQGFLPFVSHWPSVDGCDERFLRGISLKDQEELAWLSVDEDSGDDGHENASHQPESSHGAGDEYLYDSRAEPGRLPSQGLAEDGSSHADKTRCHKSSEASAHSDVDYDASAIEQPQSGITTSKHHEPVAQDVSRVPDENIDRDVARLSEPEKHGPGQQQNEWERYAKEACTIDMLVGLDIDEQQPTSEIHNVLLGVLAASKHESSAKHLKNFLDADGGAGWVCLKTLNACDQAIKIEDKAKCVFCSRGGAKECLQIARDPPDKPNIRLHQYTAV
ncbi:uncharacterized protein JN550_009285 [Neoarthrinium moseri]|uniref:uncharacterized protein n=1 Tax=Neoarthrinium moseri TaxID=1658444 RepID=UPI001FDDB624|nr:uncharacterized protein JN550_009285 [Neoarthrinium moseri]KAI1863787.1 hypothetical protein JN550_009285 [Neoarthrinium moseri]